jgi:hypothetical protein
MWAATQWVAWKLGYQPQLGQPWFELTSGVPVYLPPAFFWWWYAYDAYAPDVFVEGAYITPAKCQYRHCRFGWQPAVFDGDIPALDEAGVDMPSRAGPLTNK